MSLEVIRRIVRWAAAGAVPTAVAAAVVGMIRAEPVPAHEVWAGSILLVMILATFAVVEVMVGCKEQIVAAMPPARAIVARTLEALEAEQEREAAAGLPRIAEGRRQ